MITFTCPSCSQSFTLPMSELTASNRLYCSSCDKTIPADLLAATQQVCQTLTGKCQPHRHRELLWRITINS